MRAAIMLLVLVGLPSAWVYYGPLPPSAQGVVDRVVELAQEALGYGQVKHDSESMISAPRYQLNLSTPAPSPTVTTVDRPGERGDSAISFQAEPMLKQLRGMGAAEYSLEKWGNSGQMFRFRCAMPLVQDAEATQQFEAVAGNPLVSIQQVVGEVSSWQLARREQRRFH